MCLIDRREVRVERALLDKPFHAEVRQVQDHSAFGSRQRATWLPTVDLRQCLSAKGHKAMPFASVRFLGAYAPTSSEQERSSFN